MTRAPEASRGRVSIPVPAPMSRTRSSGRTDAAATIAQAHSSASGCHPQAPPCGGGRRADPDTADEHHEVGHGETIRTPGIGDNGFAVALLARLVDDWPS